MREVTHYYHVWCDGAWEDIVEEHAVMLTGTRWRGRVFLSLVGAEENRLKVATAFRRAYPDGWLDVAVYQDQGHEQECLDAIRRYAFRYPEHAILYCHSKGATLHDDPLHVTEWRRCMTRSVLLRWRDKIEMLSLCDAIGPHLLKPQDYPGEVESPFFGGNFWWANAAFLAKCKPCDRTTRYEAEQWLGVNGAEMMSLTGHGWPFHPHL